MLGDRDSCISDLGIHHPACSRGAQPFHLGILLLVLLGRHVCTAVDRTAVNSPEPSYTEAAPPEPGLSGSGVAGSSRGR